MKRTIRTLGIMTTAWTLAACGSDATNEIHDEVQDDTHRTDIAGSAKLFLGKLDDGSTLEIIEEGGTLLLSGSTPEGVIPLPQRYDLSVPVTELVREIFPDREVPSALIQAERRQDEYWQSRPNTDHMPTAVLPAPESSMGEPATLVLKHQNHEWFEANRCTLSNLSDQPNTVLRHLNWCRLHWSNGFHSGTFLNVRQGFGAVWVTSGSLTFRRRSKAAGAGTWNVSTFPVASGAGHWAESHSGSNSSGVDVEFELLDASGDSFHASGMYADRLICGSLNEQCFNGQLLLHHSCNDGSTPITVIGAC
jgi:hypothetical protein